MAYCKHCNEWNDWALEESSDETYSFSDSMEDYEAFEHTPISRGLKRTRTEAGLERNLQKPGPVKKRRLDLDPMDVDLEF